MLLSASRNSSAIAATHGYNNQSGKNNKNNNYTVGRSWTSGPLAFGIRKSPALAYLRPMFEFCLLTGPPQFPPTRIGLKKSSTTAIG
jgi:hypothetical protein